MLKKQAITFQTKVNYEDENFLVYGSFNSIFDALDTQKFYLRPTRKDYFSLSRISKGYSPFSEMAKHVRNLIFMEMKYSF